MSEVKTPEQLEFNRAIEAMFSETVGSNGWEYDYYKAKELFRKEYLQLSPDQIVRERLEGMKKDFGIVDVNNEKWLFPEDFPNMAAIDRVLSLLSEAPPVSKWMKVEDGLPEETPNNIVWVCDENDTVFLALFDGNWTNLSKTFHSGFHFTDVAKKWQPLPTPPKD